MLYGYSQVIIQGTLVTLELAISSVILALVIGLIGAGGKLSKSRVISGILVVTPRLFAASLTWF